MKSKTSHVEDVVNKLNVVVGYALSQNSVDHACLFARLRFINMNDNMSKLVKKVDSMEFYVKNKDCAIIDAHNRFTFMSP